MALRRRLPAGAAARAGYRWARQGAPTDTTSPGTPWRLAPRREARAHVSDANLAAILGDNGRRPWQREARAHVADPNLAAIFDFTRFARRRLVIAVDPHLCLQLPIAPELASIQLRVGTDS